MKKNKEEYIEYTILNSGYSILRSGVCKKKEIQALIDDKNFTKTEDFIVENRRTLWFEHKETKHIVIFNFEIQKA